MRYKVFGKTGMKVSVMTLGTWGMGGVGWDNYDEATRVDAIKAAFDCGINFIDTAPAYNNGAAERFLGKTLKQLGIRNELFISTKCGNFFVDGSTYVRNGHRDAVIGQVEDSLRNIQTDHIDLMLIHWPDVNTPFEETIGALNDLKRDGKILNIGVSNFSKEQIQDAGQYGEIGAFQPQYSMVNRDSEELIRWAASEGMGVMTYGSLGGGILTGVHRELKEFAPTDSRNRFYKHFHEPMFSKVQELLKVMDKVSAENGGMPLSQIALNWSVQKDFVSTCIVGAQTRAKVEENAAAFDRELDAAAIATLDAAIAKLDE